MKQKKNVLTTMRLREQQGVEGCTPKSLTGREKHMLLIQTAKSVIICGYYLLKKVICVYLHTQTQEHRVKYSQEDILKRFGFSRQRLVQLRLGYKTKRKYNGETYEYNIEPRLIKGEHWWYDDREIVFDESAIPILEHVVKDRVK